MNADCRTPGSFYPARRETGAKGKLEKVLNASAAQRALNFFFRCEGEEFGIREAN